MKRRTIAAIAVAAALAAGTAAWLLAPGERVETVTTVVTNSVTRIVERKVTEVVAIGHTDRTAECTITQGVKKVKLQVKLAKNSPAAQMQLEFRDAEGRTLGDERWTVKKSRKATLKVPQGSVKALLSAGRATGSDPATFEIFTIMAIP